MKPFPVDDLHEPLHAARTLLGTHLVRHFPEGIARVRIVETEAYDQSDPASHSFKGQTPRTAVMFGPPRFLYVYFTYGMHFCCNVVTGPDGHGSAVLIRAVEPLEGLDLLKARRASVGSNLTNGPAKLCQALGIDRALNGHDLRRSPLTLERGTPVADNDVITTTRIGISQAKDKPWRFYDATSRYVSRH